MYSRKIGLHIIGATALYLDHPRTVKIVDPGLGDYWDQRGRVGAECLIVVRWDERPQLLDGPISRADAWFEKHSAFIQGLPVGEAVVYEGYNEVGDDQAVSFREFEIERLRLLHLAGRHAAVGSWSVGCPDLAVWAVYYPLLDAMEPGDFVALHEYWVDEADLQNVWHIRRYRLPEAAEALAGLRILITETGRDVVEGRGTEGWQLAGIPFEQYLQEIRLAGELYDEDDQVHGVHVFQNGSVDVRWSNYNVWGLWPFIVEGYDPEEEVPVLPTIPYYHSSRNGYAITDIVLHDTEGPWQAALDWWQSQANPGRSSAHVLVRTTGEVILVVPDHLAAHHAGHGTIPGREGLNPNLFSLGIEFEYPVAPASPAWPEVQLEAGAGVVRAWADMYDIGPEHIWRHGFIDPDRRSDPRNWNDAAFLARVFDQDDLIALELTIGDALQAHIIPLNADAALEKAAIPLGLVAVSDEVRDVPGYVAQAFRKPYEPDLQYHGYCKDGDWGNVRFYTRAN